MKKIYNIQNVFNDRGFNNEDRYDWYRFWSKVDIKDDIDKCWNWTKSLTIHGYGQFNIGDVMVGSSRVSYILSKGSIPNELQVQHTCNNRRCCNPNHLILGDQSDNMKYMFKCNRQSKKFRGPSGENHGQAILTGDQVREIHKMHYENPELYIWKIAKMFKVTDRTVSNILSGKNWRDIYQESKNIDYVEPKILDIGIKKRQVDNSAKYIYKDNRIVNGKLRCVTVDICREIINLNPSREELKILKLYPSKIERDKDKDMLLELLRYFIRKEKRSPICEDFIGNPKYPSYKTIEKVFGTWNKALEVIIRE
jgi:hypothetical protein